MGLFSSRYHPVGSYDGHFLVFMMDMVKVVWVLGPPTLPPRKLFLVLMVVILCCQGVGIINL